MQDTSRIPEALVRALRDAHHVCVITGAGVSAESGVPTFRDAPDGLWANYDPMDLATPEAFAKDPALVWRWYRWRRDRVASVVPNTGHYALANLAGIIPRLTLITQNVDGLHQQAGSEGVIEFHGNLFEDRCFAHGNLVKGDYSGDVPACPDCGGHLRPGVVWFGENIPEAARRDSYAAAANCDVFLSIGTSSLVYPAASLADTARDGGAFVAEINPEPTAQAAAFDVVIAGKSGLVLPKLVESLSAKHERSTL